MNLQFWKSTLLWSQVRIDNR